MADSEIVDMTLSDVGMKCVAAMQEIIADADLTAPDAIMACGELFAWAHLIGLMPIGRERMLLQMDRSCESARHYVAENFDGFKARMEVVASLDAGESGGRLQ